MYKWDIFLEGFLLEESIYCIIVSMLYYFVLRMTTDYFAVIVVEFTEKHLLASVLPLSAGWMVLWFYLHISLLSCYLTYALT